MASPPVLARGNHHICRSAKNAVKKMMMQVIPVNKRANNTRRTISTASTSSSTNIGRRWLCQTALYYMQMFPSSSCRSMDPSRTFTTVCPSSSFASRRGFLGGDLSFDYFKRRRPLATQAREESAVVLSAVKELVNRLDDSWESTLVAPSSVIEGDGIDSNGNTVVNTHMSTPTPAPTSTYDGASSKSKSIEEYARIICQGYSGLPPLKLGWIATHISDLVSEERMKSWHDWECPRSAMICYLAEPSRAGLSDSSSSEVLNKWIQEAQQTGDLPDIVLQSLQKITLSQSPPVYQDFIQCLLEQSSGHTLPVLVELRGDLLRLLRALPKTITSADGSMTENPARALLRPMEDHLRKLLSTWFSPGLLDIQRITFNTTSAGIIEKIALKEAVHPMKSLDDLRRRLGPKRRVFGLFHPLLPAEPLVILHVHLEGNADNVPGSMSHVLTEDDVSTGSCDRELHRLTPPRIATFYSISNTQPGLTRGLGLGEFLIKHAVQLLKLEFPTQLHTFVTLSPMPGFRTWVEGLVGDNPEHGLSDSEWAHGIAEQYSSLDTHMIEALKDARRPLYELLQSTKKAETSAGANDSTIQEQLEKLKPLLTKLAANYLVVAKSRRSGKPVDPVTGFHVSNGAEVYRVNFAADLSRKGLLRSFGVMANYRYQLDCIERNKAAFESSHFSQIAMSESVKNLLHFDKNSGRITNSDSTSPGSINRKFAVRHFSSSSSGCSNSTSTPFYGAPRPPSSRDPSSFPQRFITALKSASTAFRDPTRDDAVAALGEVTGTFALHHLAQQMKAHPTGQLILKEKPIISKATIPYERFLQQAKDTQDKPESELTFGQAYGRFLLGHGFDPDGRKPVMDESLDPELAYIMLRYRQCHDYWHTLTGLPPTVLGELGLKWLELFQTGLPVAALSGTVGSLGLTAQEQTILWQHYVPWAIRVNRQQQACDPNGSLMTVYYEQEFDTPLVELRKRIGIEPAPVISS